MVDEQTMSLYLPVTNNPTNTLTCKLCSKIKFVIKHSLFITSISSLSHALGCSRILKCHYPSMFHGKITITRIALGIINAQWISWNTRPLADIGIDKCLPFWLVWGHFMIITPHWHLQCKHFSDCLAVLKRVLPR